MQRSTHRHGRPRNRRGPAVAVGVAVLVGAGAVGGALAAGVLGDGGAEQSNRAPGATAEPTGDAAGTPTAGPREQPTDAATGEGATAEPSEEATAPASDDDTFTILSAGDVLPHATVNRMAQLPSGGYDFVPLMENTRAWTEGADLALCSLEVPLAPPGEPVTAYPSFGAPAELITGLEALGWDGCNTATNHSMDRGLPGIIHTLDVMSEVGLGAVGTARSAEEAAAPQLYVLERNGREVVVAHLAATTLVNGREAPPDARWALNRIGPGSTGELVEQARAAREAGADLVVASIHWGTEYVHAPIQEQLTIADELAASGAIDLVFGNHSHVPEPQTMLPGGPDGAGMWVAWSMGNFISNQDDECCIPETGTGVMSTATVSVPEEGPVRVTGLEWTAVTVDRAGAQRIYPLHELVSGSRPEGLALDDATIAARAARVAEVMGTPERTEAPTPTGPEPEVLPR